MAVFVRSKRVTDPFNEKLRARIFPTPACHVSSGSEHDGENDVISSSPSLSDLVENFLEGDARAQPLQPEAAVAACSDSDDEFLRSDPTALIESVINPTVRNSSDSFLNELGRNVSKAVKIFSFFRSNKSIFNRNVMAYLRESGYNAGICKTKWNSAGNLTGGGYEFIDVVKSSELSAGGYVRYFIDFDFTDQFEIVRKTENYSKLLRSLPRVIVMKSEELKRIIRMMCDEARRSMKSSGLSLPPWRKNRYMQMKWLGPYRRTTNYFPAPAVTQFAVKCRAVGFDAAVDGGECVFASPVTRTR